jgi:gluconate kinase
MPIGLLDSQFQTLEHLDDSECGKDFDISKSIDEIVDEALSWIAS